jgi:predicted ester cyclase
MSPEELKARARRIVEEILNQGDLAVANELISPGCIHHVPGGQQPPGLAGLMGWLASTLRIFPDFHAIVEDEIAEGNQVVQRITCYGTHEGESSGVRPTGEQVTFQIIEINRAGADGKFVEHWSSADLPAVLHRLGSVEHVKTGWVNHHWLTRWPRPSPAPSPTPSRRPRSPRPPEPVLMEAHHRLGAASPQRGGVPPKPRHRLTA